MRRRITVAVVHHPQDWLANPEYNAYDNRPNTYRYLAERSHVILSGHTHGAIERPTAAMTGRGCFSRAPPTTITPIEITSRFSGSSRERPHGCPPAHGNSTLAGRTGRRRRSRDLVAREPKGRCGRPGEPREVPWLAAGPDPVHRAASTEGGAWEDPASRHGLALHPADDRRARGKERARWRRAQPVPLEEALRGTGGW